MKVFLIMISILWSGFINSGSVDSNKTVGVHSTSITDPFVMASWYNYSLDGVEWSKSHLTAASRNLPRGSYAKITNVENEKSVIVFINDYVENPKVEIDLSSYAFSQLAPLSLGLIKVKIEPIQ